jgi:hypothetical protein
MPRHNPADPLPDATHEAYVQACARGMGPTQAAATAGLKDYRRVERQQAFKHRLEHLRLEAHDSTLTLQYLVVELKRTASSARAAGQYKNANEALSQLAELYTKHSELRSDAQRKSEPGTAAPSDLAAKRAAREARLSAVSPEAAANE